jgi:four helix bundle protein
MRLGENIAERLINIGLAAFRVVKPLRKDQGTRHVAMQLIRAATSAGANYAEARAAESRLDFAHKAGLAAKEMREAHYWFTFLGCSGWLPDDLGSLVVEAAELTAILCASSRTARSNAER